MVVSIQFADRLSEVTEYYFSRKLELIRQLRAKGHDVINIGIGSPDLPPPPRAVEAASSSLACGNNHGYASYRSTPELRVAMANWYERTYSVSVDPESQLLPLLGSKEGIFYLSMGLLNPGDGVLIPDPGYPAYSSAARLLGARVHRYNLSEANAWLPDIKELERQDLGGCKLMWINYPHMPTGASGVEGAFHALAEFCWKRRILLCNDNPYGLVLNQSSPLSLLRCAGGSPFCAELNSLSKSFNMAGWRVGLLLAEKEVIDATLRVKSNVDSGMFLPVQHGAVAALATDNDWHRARNEIYQERRELVWRIFDRLGFSYDRKQVGLFVWARAPEAIPDVEVFFDELLESRHIFFTPGMVFGSNGIRYARASLCASRERLSEALRRLA
ncbi:MAG: aminotransferase class I/II-fold pyridoxal phosphate-dependent enzyme [Candidatus Riflebacteria bacterium]|nr:aminotransferase class I/II-fold pyridoxal phosphate-dependent enzyme [Candidatus Riflebacteria bacterium]